MDLDRRDYQDSATEDIVTFLTTAEPYARRMYVGPCGSGKGVIEAAVLKRLPECLLITPRDEIIAGLVKKGGDPDRIWTPVTLRNRLLSGHVKPPPYLLIDEGHHDISGTAHELRLCMGDAPAAALTATPFRGTPQGTAALRALYGEPHTIITLKKCVTYGYTTLPTCTTHPILDDDIVEINGGEFKVRAVEAKTPWRAAAALVYAVCQTPRPTVVSLPGVSATAILAEELSRLGMTTVTVTGLTPDTERVRAFESCLKDNVPLLQVQVVSEGVDLPLRRLIDFAPTMSPVRWLQQLGRIMRPTNVPPEYICANRNLLRHGYLLEGLLPSSAFAEAQAVFPGMTARNGMRAFGLEGLGKLKPCIVPLANGLKGSAYYVTRSKGHIATQYVAIVLPNDPNPLWATRANGDDWGKWRECPPPSELKGFASVPPRPVSDKQRFWWKRSAEFHGLDPNAEIDAKTFGVLPVLSHLRKRIL